MKASSAVYEFGDFRLDPANHLLSRRDGTPVPLTPRVFDTLLFLVEHDGAVLDKERLMAAVWPDSIVEENNLSQNISMLRRVFGETPASRGFIVTVPGRGYRFAAEVRTSGEATEPQNESKTNDSKRGLSKTLAEVSLTEAELSGALRNPRPTRSLRSRNLRPILLSTLAVLALSVVVLFLWRSQPQNTRTAQGKSATPAISEKSIAVLPFENRSEDKSNAYFADGIADEILTRLSKIAELKVISRTSTQHYKSAPENLSQIARQLGVAHILEGSVQKSGDAVRVNVQLIKAANDSHIWADTFDRKLTDIFDVESDIAKRIAESLRAKLTDRQELELAVKPTKNPEAYDAYLRGLAFEARSHAPSWFTSADLVLNAIRFYKRAVQLDPDFALAWARLSRMDAFLYFNPVDPTTAAWRGAAERALENAQKLEPNSPETLLALGYNQYWVLREYELAKTTFGRVSKMLPSSSEVPRALGLISRREGHWDQSIAYFEQALTLDPRNGELLITAAETYGMLRQFAAALKLYDQALDITPSDPDVMAGKASIYQAQGNLRQAASLLSEINEQTPAEETFHVKITQLRLERSYSECVRLLQARQAQFHFNSQYEKALNPVWLAFMQHLAGDTAGARVTAEQVRDTLEPLYRDQPHNFVFAASLSQAYAAMGEKHLALEAAEQAIVLLPSAKDRVSGPSLEQNLAFIQTIFDENSRAISTLTWLLQRPYGSWLYDPVPVTPALLRLDPIWDPLRADPAFQELVASSPK
jgi:TolB-like protein/DNA-binding winged helix-turn-helix (wHTH) protein/Tfp pilus assembly protein PilF